jgi:hypothetical protein
VIVLGYAKQSGDEVLLLSIEDGQPLAGARALDGVLMSRLDFDVQILEIPVVPDKEVEGLIRYRLRSIYPGNPSETAFDYRLQANGHQSRAVVFISQRSTLEKYKKAAEQRHLLLPYSLTAPLAKSGADMRVWFCQRDWAELSVFRGGLAVSSRVLQRNEGEPFDIDVAESELDAETKALPCLIVASSEEIRRLQEEMGDAQVRGFTLISFKKLLSQQRKAEGLFSPPKRTPSFLKPAVRMTALAVAVAVFGVLLFFKYVASVESRYEGLKKLHASLEKASGRTLAIQKEVDDLSSELSKLQAEKPQDLYLFLSELSSVLGGEAQIRSMTFQGDGFQIEAVGSNPLKLMEGFRNRPSFDNVKLSQVVPDARTGKERFSFSGAFHAR